MNSIWDASYFVVDLETTGSHPEKNRIFEVAWIRVENGEIVAEYSSLVNPHQFIPPYISNMTGVSNSQAYSAPEQHLVFPEVFKRMTEKPTIFVAHNAQFDFSFLKATLSRMNMNIDDVPVLCTLKLARRILPKNLKKNVGSLADYFGHKISNRHRAFDDTFATVTILNELLEMAEVEYDIETIEDLLAFQNKPIKNFRAAPPALRRIEEQLAEIPKKPGVYYFIDKNDSVLYIGKAKSLKERVSSYFSLGELSSKKTADMVKNIHDLKWFVTPSELEALLLESYEIKNHKPPFNSALKKYRRYPFIKFVGDEFPYPVMSRGNDDDNSNSVLYGPFRSAAFVEEILLEIEKRFKLRKCTKKLNPSSDETPCLYHQIDKCIAPCSLVSRDEYMKEVEKVKLYLSSLSDGIITQLENKMTQLAENLEFEKAQLIRNQIFELKRTFMAHQSVGSSINNTNLIMLLPNEESDRLTDVFLIRAGKFAYSVTIGNRAPLDELFRKVDSTFFSSSAELNGKMRMADIDELRIVTSWIYRNREKAFSIYIEGKSLESLREEVEIFLSEKSGEVNHIRGLEDIVFDDIQPYLD